MTSLAFSPAGRAAFREEFQKLAEAAKDKEAPKESTAKRFFKHLAVPAMAGAMGTGLGHWLGSMAATKLLGNPTPAKSTAMMVAAPLLSGAASALGAYYLMREMERKKKAFPELALAPNAVVHGKQR